MAADIVCHHCMEKCGGTFCRNCKTSEDRKAMCVENNKIRTEQNMLPYICPMNCLGLKKIEHDEQRTTKIQEDDKSKTFA